MLSAVVGVSPLGSHSTVCIRVEHTLALWIVILKTFLSPSWMSSLDVQAMLVISIFLPFSKILNSPL